MDDELITCPWCKETDFDEVGLKLHLTQNHCDHFNELDVSLPRSMTMFAKPVTPPTPASLRSLAEWFDDPKNPHVFVEKLGKTAGYLIRQVAEAQERS